MYHDRMFKELVESSDDIVIVTDTQFRILYASSAVTRVFGTSPVELSGKNVLDFVSTEKVAEFKKFLQARGEHTFRGEIALRTSSHKRSYFDVQVSELSPGTRIEGLMLRLHDVTSTKNKEQELIRSNQQLDQVIYKTTHDLRAPLMSALGLIRLAEQATIDEKDKYLEMVKKSLLKLDSYIEEMNDFFRSEKLAVKREKVSIVSLLNDELAIVRNLYEESGIKVEIEVTGACEFFSDNIRVKTIVANLLSNAIKYRDGQKTEPFIKIYVFVTEEFCELRVVDNGIGIAPEYHKKIFDLFFRATNQSQGTGLGLFIVKDTVEKLQGKIEVSSIPDAGTTFTIRLPNRIGQPVEVG